MSTTAPWPLKRIVLLVGLALLIPMTFMSGCFALMVFVSRQNASDEARFKAAAESDPRLKRPLVSNTGRIVFAARHEDATAFFVVNVDGSEFSQLTALRPPPHGPDPPIVSPDGTRLAVSTGVAVEIVRLDRTRDTTRLDCPGGSLAWSPDSKQLASLSIDAQKRLHLWVFNADGTGDARDYASGWPSTAAGERQSVSDLAWSPDGRRFAFALSTRPPFRRGPSHDHLYLVQSDGSGLRNLSREPDGLQAYGGLAWSPDSRRLALRGGNGLAIVDLDLKWTNILIPPHETGSPQRPAWSPDGRRLVWFDYYTIVVSEPDGNRQEALTRGRCRGVQPAWSDDGLRIAFVCRDAEKRQNIFVMNADGSGLTQITTFGADDGSPRPEYPVWLAATSAVARFPQ
jgi:Tol biopolymer transport system component